MNIIEAITNRRAVKKYDSSYSMSEQEIEQLLSLAMLSPTAFNIQNWRFVLVRNDDLRQEIRKVAWDQEQVTDSSLLILLCADLTSWKKPQRYWESAPKEVQDYMVDAIHNYYQGKQDVIRDEAMRSCGLAGQTIMLAAKELGLDSCPMDGFDYEAVGKIINLPQDHIIGFMIVVGKKKEEPKPRPTLIAYKEAVIIDRFPG